MIIMLYIKWEFNKLEKEEKKYATLYGELLSKENPRGFFKI